MLVEKRSLMRMERPPWSWAVIFWFHLCGALYACVFIYKCGLDSWLQYRKKERTSLLDKLLVAIYVTGFSHFPENDAARLHDANDEVFLSPIKTFSAILIDNNRTTASSRSSSSSKEAAAMA